jgi:hypothetical protein
VRLVVCLGGGGGDAWTSCYVRESPLAQHPSYFAGFTTAPAAKGLSLIPFSIQRIAVTFDQNSLEDFFSHSYKGFTALLAPYQENIMNKNNDHHSHSILFCAIPTCFPSNNSMGQPFNRIKYKS